jgi:ActD protein
VSASYGLMAELASADELLAAAARAREAGFRGVEAYSPFPIEGMGEAIGFTRSRVPLATLVGGVAGGAGGFFLQWYSAVVDYPINSGGRPTFSWPAFIPVTFELTVLGAAMAAVIAMIVANGLPRLRHPVFNVREFELSTRNRFFLCLPASAADAATARRFLERLQPLRILEVPC